MPRIRLPFDQRSLSQLRTPVSALTGLILAAPLLAPALPAQAEGCRLALVLALDVSGSVSVTEDRLQRGGMAAALLAPEVTRAALSSEPVALYAFEWAGETSQAILLPWILIESEQDLLDAAGVLLHSRRTVGVVGDGTAVGSALVHAAAALAAGPRCRERTVDVSGDGISSDGVEPQAVLQSFYDGVTVNALVIHEPIEDPMLDRRTSGDVQLATWFMLSVLHGPEAFHVVASGYEDYERAMRMKLLRELEMPLVSGAPVIAGGA